MTVLQSDRFYVLRRLVVDIDANKVVVQVADNHVLLRKFHFLCVAIKTSNPSVMLPIQAYMDQVISAYMNEVISAYITQVINAYIDQVISAEIQS